MVEIKSLGCQFAIYQTEGLRPIPMGLAAFFIARSSCFARRVNLNLFKITSMPEVTPQLNEQGQITFEVSDTKSSPSFDSAKAEVSGFGTLEDVERHQLSKTAQGLSRRRQTEALTEGVADEDLDRGSFEHDQALYEEQLREVQLKLHRSTNPLEQAQLAYEAESIAMKLVGDKAQQEPEQDAAEEEQESFLTNIKAELGEEAIGEVLQYAADALPEEAAEALNTLLADEDQLVQKTTFETLQHLQSSPEHFATDRSAYAPLSDNQQLQVNEICGHEVGGQIATLAAAIAGGVATPTDALRLASKDPALMRGLISAARAGAIRIAL